MKLFTREESTQEPTLQHPVSQICTQSQFMNDIYVDWCEKIREEPRHHRKQWEFVYIAQVLKTHGMLAPGKKGLGFGVGQEPLPALFASFGCNILATDLAAEEAADKRWVESGQHVGGVKQLRFQGICEEERFFSLVQFRTQDMNAIEPDLQREAFDFVWSSCALEHLGSIKHGLDFIRNTLNCIKKGGLVVHTTEFNVSSNIFTINNNPSTVLFRKRDLMGLIKGLRKEGYIIDINWYSGNQPLDKYVDLPPYKTDPHLKLKLGRYVSTSMGLVIQKPE